jgi:hypothetical protein
VVDVDRKRIDDGKALPDPRTSAGRALAFRMKRHVA